MSRLEDFSVWNELRSTLRIWRYLVWGYWRSHGAHDWVTLFGIGFLRSFDWIFNRGTPFRIKPAGDMPCRMSFDVCHSAIFCHQRNLVSESRERRLSASLCRERWFAPSLCRSSLVSNWLVHVHVVVSRTRDECCCVMCYKSRPTWIVRRVDSVGNWRDGPDYHYKIQG